METKQITIKYSEYLYSELSEEDAFLITQARIAAKTSYSPYSNFKVGAAVLLDNGNIIKGSNQENAAYPSGLCAERVCLFFTNANYPDNIVKTIAITAFNNNNLLEDVITPCGACRQVILETENRYNSKCRILLDSKNKILEFQSIKDLLPFSFGEKSLK